jgi:uncharacterized protein (TIGR01777 family)
MAILVAGGTGFIGKQLVKALLANNEKVTLLSRSNAKTEALYGKDVEALEWMHLDTADPNQFSAVINLCGRSISALRWTDAVKQSILASRVETTTKIAEWCAKANHKPHLYNASAIGIYGLQPTGSTLSPPLTEQDKPPVQPTDFLSQVGIAWENATKPATAAGVPVSFLRFGVVLKSDGGVLNVMKLSFKLGLGCRLGTGKQAFSWVHADDVVAVIMYLLKHPTIVGPVNIVAPECVTQETFAKTFAKILQRPCVFSTPEWAIKLMLGQMGDELILRGQHVYPSRLMEEEFKFRYPALQDALEKEFAMS